MSEIRNIDPTDVVKIEQLPIIKEQLYLIKEQFEAEVRNAISLDCTEDTLQEVKKLRARLGKIFEACEGKRKEVKKQVLSPYDSFEDVYKDCVTDVYTPAKAELDRKIATVENELLYSKTKDAIEFFTEYSVSLGIDFISFDQLQIKIIRSSSLKSVKAEIKRRIDQIVDDLTFIATQDHSPEILVEYKKSLNLTHAVTTVTNRIRAIDEERRRTEERKNSTEKEQQNAGKVKKIAEAQRESISAPTVKTVPPVQEQTYNVTFEVNTSLDKLKNLVNYMKQEGIIYEQLK